MRLRSTVAALSLASVALAPLAAHAQEDKARTYTQKEIEQIILKTILDNPEVIIESVQKMQLKEQASAEEQAKQAVQAYRTSLFEDEDSPKVGPEDADITIVEFFDYNCGYCKRSMPNVMRMIENDKKVNFVFKEYPVLAPSSEQVARASLAMYYLEPEHYFDYHTALFRLGGKFDEASMTSLAEGLGADAEEFKEMMQSERVTQHIDDTRELAGKMGMQGVPAFVIGSQVFPGAISYETMKQEVDAIRAAMKKEDKKKG